MKRPPSAKSKKSKPDTEKDSFISVARRLGCDESPEAFDRAFSKIVPPKAQVQSSPKRKKREES
jgi:hypothetical protein